MAALRAATASFTNGSAKQLKSATPAVRKELVDSNTAYAV